MGFVRVAAVLVAVTALAVACGGNAGRPKSAPATSPTTQKAMAAGELKMPAVDASVLRLATVKGPKPGCGP